MAEPLRILVIEDEAAIRRFLRSSLDPGTTLLEAETAAAGIQAAARSRPDLILLDLGLPDGDGLEVLRDLRAWSGVPIIVLSARGREADKVAALDGGADDYLTKPFLVGELLARVRVALRHAKRSEPEEPAIRLGDLAIDLVGHTVSRGGELLRLTPIEFRLLALLARHPGRVLTHAAILREVWGPAYEEDTHTLRVHMGNLRRKIEEDPARPSLVRTELGVGYRATED